MYVVCVYCIWKSILCLYLVADCNLLDQPRLELNSNIVCCIWMYVVCVYCIWKSILCLLQVADCNLLDQRRLELNSAEMRTKHGFSLQKFQMAEIVMQSDRDGCRQIQPKVPVVSPGFEMLAQCSKCWTMLSNQPFWSQLCTVILPLTVQLYM